MKSVLLIVFLISSIYACAQEPLTIGKVFDFEIGDKFQYKRNTGGDPGNASRLTILDKYYSAEKDTVFYTINRSYYNRYNSDGSYNFEHDTIYQFYTNLDSSILSYRPELSYDSIVSLNKDWINIEDIYYDTIVEFDPNFCNKITTEIRIGLYWFQSERHIWGEGLGLVKRFIDTEEDPSGYVENYYLFYFKKSNCEFGSPDLTDISENIDNNELVRIFPNPANNFVNVDILANYSGPIHIGLYDLTGRLLKYEMNLSSVSFDVGYLSKGIYIITIEHRKFKITQKLFVK